TTWPPGELLDELCQRARQHVVLGEDDGAAEARAVLDAARNLELIDEAVDAILTSVYIDGLSGAEAGQRHGTSAGSIRVRCS
ncbi:hypothetical protein, partial [Vibrio cincinnatiensis]|uniref:hypothetical protein n=1 Tax=Vibrio cincinnatiensis TaxID=675 RepID=UPI001FAA40BD